MAFEPTDVKIEDRKLVLAEYIRVRVLLDATPDLGQDSFQVVSDVGVEVAFGVASNVESALVVESSHTVDVC